MIYKVGKKSYLLDDLDQSLESLESSKQLMKALKKQNLNESLTKQDNE